MTNIRVLHNKSKPYLQLNRKSIQRTDISFAARGLWAYILSLPDDFHINVRHLITQSDGGRDMIYSLLNQLKECGLCYLLQRRQVGGKWAPAEYIIAESTEALMEELEELKKCLPRTAFPLPVKPGVYIRDKEHKKEIPKGIKKEVAVAPSPPPKKSKPKKPKKSPSQKKKHGDHVLLSDEELSNLQEKLGVGTAHRLIKRLDAYIGSKGKKYKSHYYTIVQWNLSDEEKNPIKKPSKEVKRKILQTNALEIFERMDREREALIEKKKNKKGK